MVRTRLNNSLFQTIKFSLPVVIAITLILTSSGGAFAYNDYDNPPCFWSYTSGQRKTLYWQYGSSNIFDEWRQAYSASLIDWTNATNRVGFTWSSSASNKLYMYASIDGRGGYTIWSCSGSIMVKDVIIIGTVEEIEPEHFNAARNPSDYSQPSTDLEILATIYRIHPEKYIKGKPKEVLRVFQAEGIQIPESENKNSNTIRVSDGYLPLTAGGRYLFFLQSTMSFPDAPYPDLYHGVAEPWRFRVEDGQALPETAWELSVKYFPPTELNHLVEDIELEALGN
jgi:hypothetical protein